MNKGRATDEPREARAPTVSSWFLGALTSLLLAVLLMVGTAFNNRLNNLESVRAELAVVAAETRTDFTALHKQLDRLEAKVDRLTERK